MMFWKYFANLSYFIMSKCRQNQKVTSAQWVSELTQKVPTDNQLVILGCSRITSRDNNTIKLLKLCTIFNNYTSSLGLYTNHRVFFLSVQYCYAMFNTYFSIWFKKIHVQINNLCYQLPFLHHTLPALVRNILSWCFNYWICWFILF